MSMKLTFLNFIFFFFFIANNNFQLTAMEEPHLEIFTLAIQAIMETGKTGSQSVIANLHDFTSLNEMLLSEMQSTKNRMPQNLKEETQDLQITSNAIIKEIEKNPYNLNIYPAVDNILGSVASFVGDLEKQSTQEPVIMNYLGKYYTILGRLTSETHVIRRLSQCIPKSK